MFASAALLPEPLAIATKWAAAAAIAEWPSGLLDDNVRITLAVGATLSLIRMFAA